MSVPLVSYVIITMNRHDELSGCLLNLRAQKYSRKQVIVVDNGSTDNTVQMVRQQFPEVQLVPLESNQGVAGGRNRGIEAAKGEVCIFIDDDARLIDPETTSRVVEYFKTDEQLACVAFHIYNAFNGKEDYKTIPRIDKKSLKTDYYCSYFCGCGFALRRQLFVEIGMFWEKLFYSGEELDFSYRLIEHGYRLIYSASIKVAHREVPDARPKGQWVYYNARNRFWIALKNLPWIYVFTTTALWWMNTAFISLKSGHLIFFIRGLIHSLKGLKEVMKQRRCISKSSVKNIKQLSGRCWY